MDAREHDSMVMDDAAPVAVETVHGHKGFWLLIATQFQGAYSDNILRNLLLSMIVGMGLARSERETFISVVTFLFSVPFLLFSMPGGWLADRYSKRQVTLWTKAMEIVSMAVATVGLATHTLSLSLVALTLVATQAALFGPSKYGLLPELLPAKRLSWGNGVIELGTFLAIIVGTVTGATMARAIPRPRSLCRICFAGALAAGHADQFRHRQGSRGCSREKIQLQYFQRPVDANRADAPGPGTVSRSSRQYLLLVPGLPAVFDHRGLWA